MRDLSLSIYVYASFTFGFEGGMWDLNALALAHCLSFSFTLMLQCVLSYQDIIVLNRS